MIEAPSAAFRQSSPERRSPTNKSASFPAGNRPKTSFKRSKRLEGRTKHRILVKPYSRSVSTTLVPIKPLDPVTRIGSSRDTMYSEFNASNERAARSNYDHNNERLEGRRSTTLFAKVFLAFSHFICRVFFGLFPFFSFHLFCPLFLFLMEIVLGARCSIPLHRRGGG